MADYYPLIARAIAGLDPSAPGEARRALYERARSALIAQLRSVQPPLSESEITRERLSLEEAVRKVESEAAQRAREASRAGSRAGDAFRAGTPRANPAKPGEARGPRAGPPPRARLPPRAPPAQPPQAGGGPRRPPRPRQARRVPLRRSAICGPNSPCPRPTCPRRRARSLPSACKSPDCHRP